MFQDDTTEDGPLWTVGAINCTQPISYIAQSSLLKVQLADCVEAFAKKRKHNFFHLLKHLLDFPRAYILGTDQGHVEAISGPDRGQIRATSGPNQGQIRATSGPYQGHIRYLVG